MRENKGFASVTHLGVHKALGDASIELKTLFESSLEAPKGLERD